MDTLTEKQVINEERAVIIHSNQYRNKLNNDLLKIHKNKRMNVFGKLCFDENEITL